MRERRTKSCRLPRTTTRSFDIIERDSPMVTWNHVNTNAPPAMVGCSPRDDGPPAPSRNPLDHLHALAQQDLGPQERLLVDQDIRRWELHRQLEDRLTLGTVPGF